MRKLEHLLRSNFESENCPTGCTLEQRLQARSRHFWRQLCTVSLSSTKTTTKGYTWAYSPGERRAYACWHLSSCCSTNIHDRVALALASYSNAPAHRPHSTEHANDTRRIDHMHSLSPSHALSEGGQRKRVMDTVILVSWSPQA